jgi:hypothetical protein
MLRISFRLALLGLVMGQVVSCEKPVKQLWIERQGLWKCESGSAIIKRTLSFAQEAGPSAFDPDESMIELRKGVRLITEGFALLNQAYEEFPPSGGHRTDISRYIEALKVARRQMEEFKKDR